MKLNNTLQHIRKQLGLTQSYVSKGIVSQSSYSRFERGLQTLSLDEIQKIINRLGIQLNDINELSQEENIHIAFIRNQLQPAFNNKLSLQELNNLYRYTKEYQNESLMLKRYYYYVRQHFSKKSNAIPPLTKQDIDSIFELITSTKKLTSIYLQYIIDFTVQFTNEQIKTISSLFDKSETKWGNSIDTTSNRLLPNVFSNLTDSLIDRAILAKTQEEAELIKLVPPLLEKLKHSLEVVYSFDFNILYKYSTCRYNYYTATDNKEITKAIREINTVIDNLTQSQQLSEIPNPYAESCINGLKNLLKTGLPKENPWYIIT